MRRFVIVYFLFSFFFFTLFSSGFLDSQDGLQYLAIARRIYYDQTFEMPEESYDNDQNIHMSNLIGRDGEIFGTTGLGYSLALLPAVFIEDIFLRTANVSPISAFPLQNDWPVLLFASMTNAFFGALLVSVMYLYLRILKIKHQTSVFLSFFLVVSSNLFPYTKYSFAHMMFTSFLLLTFYLVKKFTLTQKKTWIILAGVSFGVVTISYNQTFIIAAPSLVIYYFLCSKNNLNKKSLFSLFKNALFGVLGYIPIALVYMGYNQFRLGSTGTGEISQYADNGLLGFPQPYVIVEGLWGLLFSSGKSIFLFSPLLLLIIIFWSKLKKRLKPEIVASLTLFLTYFWFIGTFEGNRNFLLWHGESSWGPRYMLPVLPLLLVLVAFIYTRLNLKQKLFVFLPLMLIGIYVQLLGILLPYQIRYRSLPKETFIGETQFKISEFGNFIPRYSPVFNMSKTLAKRLVNLKRNFGRNKNDVELRDGFDQPLDLGPTVWRGIRPFASINFSDPTKYKVREISLQIKNHQISPPSSQSANLSFYLNENKLNPTPLIVQIEEEREFKFDLDIYELQKKNNVLKIESNFESTSAAYLKKKQALFLQVLRINDQPQNIESISFPYVSPVSKSLLKIDYDYWGGQEKDPWAIWHMHSGVYENTFDLWWLRPFHYWDMPKDFFLSLFGLNLLGLSYFGWKTLSYKY